VGRPDPVGRPAQSLVSPVLAGELNRARVLKTLYAHGPLARADLARLTGSTRATIGQIVQPLLDSGVLEEREPLASGPVGGKPRRPVWFSPTGSLFGAVCLLPGGVQVALVSASGEVGSGVDIRLRARDGKQRVVDDIVGALEQVTRAAPGRLRGVGIAVGGMVDADTGTIVRMNLAPFLDGLPIGAAVTDRTGIASYVDGHPRAQALGDLWFGAGRGLPAFASVYIGAGIGAGFILNGSVYRGAGGAGGEVGHASVDYDGPLCRCGLRGCWELIATLRWLRRTAADRGLPGAGRMTAARLTALASRGDAGAAALIEEYGHNIAVGLANLQQTLAPGVFVVHGDPCGGGERLRAVVERELSASTYTHPAVAPRVMMAEPDDFATLRGAACIVLSRQLDIAF
jgi:predicted NBD/HSP70 family sugar kinase